MLKRRKFIINYLNEFIPNVLSNLISEYDYYFIGKSKRFLENVNEYAQCGTILSNDQEIRLVTNSDGRSMGIWNIQTEMCEIILNNAESYIYDCIVLSDGRIATISNFFTLKIWNIFGSLPPQRSPRHQKTGYCDITFKSVRCCTCLSNELLVIAFIDNTLEIWNIHKMTKECELSLDTHTGWITQLHCISSPDGLIVSGSSTGELKIWNVYRTISGDLTTKCQLNLEGHSKSISCCAILSDGQRCCLVSGSHDETLRIWNVQTGTSSRRARSSDQQNITKEKCELILK
jgi:WD40 repeat protein